MNRYLASRIRFSRALDATLNLAIPFEVWQTEYREARIERRLAHEALLRAAYPHVTLS